MSATLRAAGLASALFAAANAHGQVQGVIYKGEWIQGYTPSLQFANPEPVTPGWRIPDDLSNGFVDPPQYASDNITCHVGAQNAQTHINVTAGDTLTVSWTVWPASHVGPMLSYLAPCGDSCETVDKSTLEFFKIEHEGLVNPDGTSGVDKWASDFMIAQNNSWDVVIPSSLASGNYVLRHETIALHSAGQANGAQNYPFCMNLAVSGTGTDKPAGVKATSFYKATDPGISINVYQSLSTYDIPGPTLWSGAAKNPNPTASGGAASTGAASSAPVTSGAATPSSTSSVSSAVAAVTSPATTAAPVPTSQAGDDSGDEDCTDGEGEEASAFPSLTLTSGTAGVFPTGGAPAGTGAPSPYSPPRPNGPGGPGASPSTVSIPTPSTSTVSLQQQAAPTSLSTSAVPTALPSASAPAVPSPSGTEGGSSSGTSDWRTFLENMEQSIKDFLSGSSSSKKARRHAREYVL